MPEPTIQDIKSRKMTIEEIEEALEKIPNEPTIEEIEEALKTVPENWRWTQVYELAGHNHWALQTPDSAAQGRICSVELVLNANWPSDYHGPFNERPHLRFVEDAPRYIRFLLARVEAAAAANRAEFDGHKLTASDLRKALTRVAALEGVLAADDARLVDAAKGAGVTFSGCDTADHLADRVLELQKALSDLMAWGVEHDNPGIGYITVQVDRAAVEQAHVVLGNRGPVNHNLDLCVEELDLEVRLYNCLKNAHINTVGELVQKTEQEMLKNKNFGRKSLNDIKTVLATMELHLGMRVNERGEPVQEP